MKVTVRLKITVLFAVLFSVLAAVLVTTAYTFVSARTTPQAEFAAREVAFRDALTEAGAVLPPMDSGPVWQPHPHGDGMVIVGPGDQVTVAFRDIEEQARQGVLDDLLQKSILAFIIVSVFAIPLAWWLAGRVLRPLDDVVDEARVLSATSLSRRLPNDGPDDEFRRLKTAFNGMLDRLESAFEARQRFAADASHELRTPLAVMRAKAENALDGGRVSPDARALALEVREQVIRSDSLVESLLTLARADDVGHTRDAVDLADIVASAASRLADDAARAGVALDLDLKDAPVVGDAILLERMAANALDNAIRYNLPSGGKVRCSTATDGDAAVLSISNDGPRVEAKQIPQLFERFARGETRTETGGHGLGLPIIKRVAEAHGGSVQASTRRGGGLSLEVRLPLAKAT
jgi:signal transduction histidine kinase